MRLGGEMLMRAGFRNVVLPVLTGLMAVVAVLPFTAHARCYGPAKFRTCEDLDNGARVIVAHEGHNSVIMGADPGTGHTFQGFATTLGQTTYSSNIDFHGRVSFESLDSYASSQYHIEARNFDKRPYTYQCTVLLGCY
ncbi:MAG: hypothetical protein ABF665_00895 [Gluconacetobacter sp.]